MQKSQNQHFKNAVKTRIRRVSRVVCVSFRFQAYDKLRPRAGSRCEALGAVCLVDVENLSLHVSDATINCKTIPQLTVAHSLSFN